MIDLRGRARKRAHALSNRRNNTNEEKEQETFMQNILMQNIAKDVKWSNQEIHPYALTSHIQITSDYLV